MKTVRNLFFILIATSIIGLSSTSCHKRDYPCPGLGKSNEADLSMFDENGQLKSEKDKGRIDKKNGLIKKKKPKKLQAKRKTQL